MGKTPSGVHDPTLGRGRHARHHDFSSRLRRANLGDTRHSGYGMPRANSSRERWAHAPHWHHSSGRPTKRCQTTGWYQCWGGPVEQHSRLRLGDAGPSLSRARSVAQVCSLSGMALVGSTVTLPRSVFLVRFPSSHLRPFLGTLGETKHMPVGRGACNSPDHNFAGIYPKRSLSVG